MLAEQGYTVDLGVHMPSWVTFVGDPKQPGTFEFNERAELFRRIVHMALDDKSSHAIAKSLCDEKVATSRNRQWSGGLISHILHSPLLVGTTTLCGKALDHYYPALITDEEWGRLQMLLSHNSNRRGGAQPGFPVRNIFRNRSKCAACGGPVTTHQGHLRSGRVNYYYECYNRRLGLCHVSK